MDFDGSVLKSPAKLVLLLVLVLYPAIVFPEEPDWEEYYTSVCDSPKQDAPAPQYPQELKNTHLEALQIRSLICSGRPEQPTDAALLQYMSDMLFLTKGLEPLMPTSKNYSDDVPINQQLKAVWRKLELGHVPVMFVDCYADEDVCVADFKSLEPIEFNQTECNSLADNMDVQLSCKGYLAEFAKQYNFGQGSVSQLQAAKTVYYLDNLDHDWSRFYERAKSQTGLELIVNGAEFQRGKIAYQYSKPPNRQWVILHPGAVIEYVGAAEDGSQTKGALMLEWVGIDYWRQDRWYIPTGASLVSVYTDRDGADDLGHGISLNFRSKFSIGVTGLNGNTGFFLSVDLWRLVQDKVSTLEAYRGELNL